MLLIKKPAIKNCYALTLLFHFTLPSSFPSYIKRIRRGPFILNFEFEEGIWFNELFLGNKLIKGIRPWAKFVFMIERSLGSRAEIERGFGPQPMNHAIERSFGRESTGPQPMNHAIERSLRTRYETKQILAWAPQKLSGVRLRATDRDPVLLPRNSRSQRVLRLKTFRTLEL